jgi:tRNA (cmo5U34)-methyltransferase
LKTKVFLDFRSGCAICPAGASTRQSRCGASAYTVHNFLETYRDQVLTEIFRVLRSGGIFLNGDRYALDDTAEHTRLTQEEVRGYFKAFSAISRLDLLEQWVLHLFSDESADHNMRLARR